MLGPEATFFAPCWHLPCCSPVLHFLKGCRVRPRFHLKLQLYVQLNCEMMQPLKGRLSGLAVVHGRVACKYRWRMLIRKRALPFFRHVCAISGGECFTVAQALSASGALLQGCPFPRRTPSDSCTRAGIAVLVLACLFACVLVCMRACPVHAQALPPSGALL